MTFREVSVVQIKEVLRRWLREDEGLRSVALGAGVDRKTARRYVEAAVALGLDRDGGESQLTDELIGGVCDAVRPAVPPATGPRGSCSAAMRTTSRRGWRRTSPWPRSATCSSVVGRGSRAHPAAVLRRALRSGTANDDGAGGRRRTGQGTPDRLRPHGHHVRSAHRAPPGRPRAHRRGRVVAPHVLLAHLRAAHRRRDRRAGRGLGVLRRRASRSSSPTTCRRW